MEQKQPLKKMIPQLLISVSLFSFFVSFSSLYHSSSSSSSSSLVYPGSLKFHHYFSANSFQLNKNCLFLICNGLLVFLAKTSGLIQPPAARDLNVDLLIGDTTFHKYVLDEETTTTAAADPSGSVKSAGDGLEEVSIFIAESEEEVEGEIATAAADDVAEKHEDEPACRSCWIFDEDAEQLYADEDEDEDDDEDDDEDEDEMSTEELNQKFEAFIRKMREEIIINESRQKALLLN